MSNPIFSKIKHHKIKDLFRDENHWNDWLAENIEIFSQVLSVVLENPVREVNVEGLRADILCTFQTSGESDTESDHFAVIESQLKTSDSKHLGQIITYGAQHKAKYCIWIAESFRPSHLKTLDLLNDLQTDTDRFYFPVIPEIISIGDDKKALNLTIARLDPEQPFTSKLAIPTDSLWQFWDRIRQNLSSETWFGLNKATTGRGYKFAASIGSPDFYVSYGWRFLSRLEDEKDVFVIWVEIAAKPAHVFVKKAKDLLVEIYGEGSFGTRGTDRFTHYYFKYPSQITTADLEDPKLCDPLVRWASEEMKKLVAETRNRLRAIRDELLSK